MPEEPAPRAGYEPRDVPPPLVVGAAAVLVLLGVSLHTLLWEVSQQVVPEQDAAGASPPVVMPGDAAVNDRVRAVPPPRLDPLEPLEARPPSFRSSLPAPGETTPTQRPEDLRADRQPRLSGYGWVEKGSVARIPIGAAMDAVVEAGRARKGNGW